MAEVRLSHAALRELPARLGGLKMCGDRPKRRGAAVSEYAMRLRDARAVLFWVASTIVLVFALEAAFRSWVLSGIGAAAYDAWLLSRPRMIRLFRRLRGERLQRLGGYFID